MPFLPGGNSVDLKTTAATTAAAADAETGAWLRRLERRDGRPPGRVAAPGLPRGVFGAWGLPDEEAALCDVDDEPPAAAATRTRPQPSAAAATAAAALPSVPAPAPKLSGPSAAAKAARAEGAAIFEGLWMLGAEADAADADDDEEDEEEEGGSEATPSEAGSAVADGTAATAPALSALEQAAAGVDADGAGAAAAAVDIHARPDGDTLDALLMASAASAARPSPAAAAGGPLSPSKRRRGDLEFAVRGGIDDVAGGWKALKAKGMALAYPFELDAFQKEAVLHLEQGHSVRLWWWWCFGVRRVAAGALLVVRFEYR